jgi:L-lysine 2,3-aminomutase
MRRVADTLARRVITKNVRVSTSIENSKDPARERVRKRVPRVTRQRRAMLSRS